MNETHIITVAILFLAAYALQEWSHRSERRTFLLRESEYLKIIRSLENKILAKDLTGYMTVDHHDVQKELPPQPEPATRSDEEEADLYEMRARQNNGGTF